MIRAECHSDDFVYDANFDATPWFEQASTDEIIALARVGWGGDREADEVARFFKTANVDVLAMFDYLEKISDRYDSCGFECRVNEADALAWVIANRPDMATRLEAG